MADSLRGQTRTPSIVDVGQGGVALLVNWCHLSGQYYTVGLQLHVHSVKLCFVPELRVRHNHRDNFSINVDLHGQAFTLELHEGSAKLFTESGYNELPTIIELRWFSSSIFLSSKATTSCMDSFALALAGVTLYHRHHTRVSHYCCVTRVT